jgi:hypothetical protein
MNSSTTNDPRVKEFISQLHKDLHQILLSLFSKLSSDPSDKKNITLENFFQLLPKLKTALTKHEPKDLQYLFSKTIQRILADGRITIEDFLKLPKEAQIALAEHEPKDLQYFFSKPIQCFIADGKITAEDFLKLSKEKQRALAEKAIFTERFLQTPKEELANAEPIFSELGQKAVNVGQSSHYDYLEIPKIINEILAPQTTEEKAKQQEGIKDSTSTPYPSGSFFQMRKPDSNLEEKNGIESQLEASTASRP